MLAIVNQIDGNFVSFYVNRKTGLVDINSVLVSENNLLTSPSFILNF